MAKIFLSRETREDGAVKRRQRVWCVSMRQLVFPCMAGAREGAVGGAGNGEWRLEPLEKVL